MLNITTIPSSRVPVIDARTGLISREWFAFFQNLFVLTGAGNNDTTLQDLQLVPPVMIMPATETVTQVGWGRVFMNMGG